MHNNNTKTNVLCLASNEFVTFLSELKEYLYFSVDFSNEKKSLKIKDHYKIILIETNLIENFSENFFSTLAQKDIVLLCNSNKFKKINHVGKINLPVSLIELNEIIKKVNIGKKFVSNSSIKIKDYILDKNEKKLKKNNLFIFITEKEIQLLELLFSSTEPIMKKNILNIVWNYASDADTHTVETHIYRLRKKILGKFKDENLIKNTKKGYII
jgi:hypothetical protein